MIDKTKRYRTPRGEIVTGAELVEATAEDVIRAVIEKLDGCTDGQFTENIVTALREAGMLKEAEDDGWIKHDGGPCPVDEDAKAVIEICFSDGSQHRTLASFPLNWSHVTHYRVVGE